MAANHIRVTVGTSASVQVLTGFTRLYGYSIASATVPTSATIYDAASTSDMSNPVLQLASQRDITGGPLGGVTLLNGLMISNTDATHACTYDIIYDVV